jgi:hypothetical protein
VQSKNNQLSFWTRDGEMMSGLKFGVKLFDVAAPFKMLAEIHLFLTHFNLSIS